MNAESLEFIQTLFAHESVGAVALTALPVEPGSTLTYHVPLTLPTILPVALSRLQARNTEGTVNALVGIATRRPGLTRYQRGGKTDLLELPALYADIDQPPADVYPFLARFRPTPSLVISSGLGTHLYWLLAEPTTDFHRCSDILSGLAQALGGDRLTVAQSLRLPGTQNLKEGRGPCFIIQSEPQRLYTLNDFAAYLPPRREPCPIPLPSGKYLDDLAHTIASILIADYDGCLKATGWIAARCPAGHSIDRPGKHFYYVESESKSRGRKLSANIHLAALPKSTLDYLAYGATVGQRNTALFAAACQFRDAGYTVAEACGILIPRYLADSEAHEQTAARDREARRTIRSAYTRPPRLAIRTTSRSR